MNTDKDKEVDLLFEDLTYKVTTQLLVFNYETRERREKGMDIDCKEESYRIIGACFEVHKEKGNGFLEAVSENQTRKICQSILPECFRGGFFAPFACFVVKKMDSGAVTFQVAKSEAYRVIHASGVAIPLRRDGNASVLIGAPSVVSSHLLNRAATIRKDMATRESVDFSENALIECYNNFCNSHFLCLFLSGERCRSTCGAILRRRVGSPHFRISKMIPNEFQAINHFRARGGKSSRLDWQIIH